MIKKKTDSQNKMLSIVEENMKDYKKKKGEED